MGRFMFLSAVMVASVASAAIPTVTNVKWTQSGVGDRTVDIEYTIDRPGIVTLDITTNGVSIGDANLTVWDGEVNMYVTNAGVHKVKWFADRSWPDHRIAEAIVKPEIRAWDDYDPPDYLVVDLLPITNATRYYYSSVEALPGGILSNVLYRQSLMPFRRIHAKGVEWMMGAPVGEPGATYSHEILHSVTLENDYYIGVFELTQAQYYYMNEHSSKYNYSYFMWKDGGMRPQEGTSRAALHGSDDNAGSWYPNRPLSTSSIGKLRTAIGFATLDFPSDAQWEFACRAGLPPGYWPNGEPIAEESTNGLYSAKVPGRYLWSPEVNGKTATAADGSSANHGGAKDAGVYLPDEGGTAVCGSYPPNGYGLYDMIGNVAELVLDMSQYISDIPAADRRVGRINCCGYRGDGSFCYRLDGTATNLNIWRGGGWKDEAKLCRPSYRECGGNIGTGPSRGYRLCITLENEE